MPLVRVQVDTPMWRHIVAQWTSECALFNEQFSDFAPATMAHALKIASENPPDPTYGIYAIVLDGLFHGLVHVNCAGLPKTQGQTLRLVWTLLSPRYDFDEITPEDFATVAAELIDGALATAKSEMISHQIKIHAASNSDRQFFQSVGERISASEAGASFKVRGNWLEISNLQTL